MKKKTFFEVLGWVFVVVLFIIVFKDIYMTLHARLGWFIAIFTI